MKAEIIKTNKFTPFTIGITFETEREYMFLKQLIGEHSGNSAADMANSNNTESNFLSDFTAIEASSYIDVIFQLLHNP